jgi:uncharacterized protein
MNAGNPSDARPVPDARLVPDEPLPPYSYVTGRFPHPTRDLAGHHFGRDVAVPGGFDPNQWRQARAYLVGCDLFNHGYYWEAHESWEAVWKACGTRGPTADFLKGLIKLAAAGVKVREGRAAGVRRHGKRAAELFRAASGQALQPDRAAMYLGLNVSELIRFADALAGELPLPEPTGAPVEIVFDLRLRPASSGS